MGGLWWGGCSPKEDSGANEPVNGSVQHPLFRQVSRCNDASKEDQKANPYRNPRVQ